ncbi:MAG: SBBP repeat-containing protein, partial [Candidatus Poseidoniales archaeon]|nr:SBBP repeat-containing protein [Candidatus Poseidoniales archaeon]
MRPRLVAFFLVGLMLIAPAIGLSESLLEENKISDSSARSTNNALLWGAHVAGSGSTDSVMSIEMDAMGRTYVCGYFYNTATFGNITLSSYGSYDIFVGRLSNGAWDWVQKAGGTNSDQCHDIAVDDGGNITITGYYYSSSTANFGSQSMSGQGSNDIFISRLDTNGNWIWSKSAGGTSADYGYGVAMDNSGNAYLTGYYYNTGYFGSITLSAYSYDEAFLAKLDNTGNFVWAKRFYGSYYQRGRDVDVNANGDIAV